MGGGGGGEGDGMTSALRHFNISLILRDSHKTMSIDHNF